MKHIRILFIFFGVVIWMFCIAYLFGQLPVRPGAKEPNNWWVTGAFCVATALIVIPPSWFGMIGKGVISGLAGLIQIFITKKSKE